MAHRLGTAALFAAMVVGSVAIDLLDEMVRRLWLTPEDRHPRY